MDTQPTSPMRSSETDDRRHQILEAAMRVFSTKGFHKTTNKDIAEAAGGISPGLIYHYFKDKHDLFMSIITERMPIFQLVEHTDELLELPPREALSQIGLAYLRALQAPGTVAFFRIVLGDILQFPQLADAFYRGTIARVFGVVKRYLQHQIDTGVLKPHDTSIATRTLMGGFLAHVLVRELFRQPEAIAADTDQVVAQVVDTFLYGLTVERV